jgi:hypothetical protein
MLRRLLQALAIVVLLTGPSAAQLPMPSLHLGEERTLTPEERAKQQAIDDAYRAANKKVPDKKTAADPWGDVRSEPPKQKR